MNQASSLLRLDIREIHNAEFLKRLEWLVPWTELVALIELFYPEDENAHPPPALKAMLHTNFLQLLFTMSGPAMAEAFLDVPLYREFALLTDVPGLPDKFTVLRFRHRLENHDIPKQVLSVVNGIHSQRGLLLRTGLVGDAAPVAAPTSAKDHHKSRDRDMYSGNKVKPWHFGVKSHIGANAGSTLVQSVHAQAMRRGKRRARALNLHHDIDTDTMLDKAERLMTAIRATVEHRFDFVKVRYHWLAENTARRKSLVALSNMWLFRHKLLGASGHECARNQGHGPPKGAATQKGQEKTAWRHRIGPLIP